MRILHILDHSIPLHSGYTFRTLAILKEQRALEWETFHLTSQKQGGFKGNEEDVNGWHFYRTQPALKFLMKIPVLNQWLVINNLTRQLRRVAQMVKPDILHAHSPALNAIAALRVGRDLGIPVVYEVRAFWEDAAVDHGTSKEGGIRYRLTRALENYAVKHSDAITTICEGLRKDLVARGVSCEKITIIPNGVNTEDFAIGGNPDSDLIKNLDLNGKTVLGFIGSFYAYEGLNMLIQALPTILEHNQNIRVLLVGGGEQEEKLKNLAVQLNVADKVIFTGRVPHSQVQRYYNVIDVLVYPRIRMRLTELVTPLKPLEAMAQGRLLVASDVGGHHELIVDGQTGVLFKAGDAYSLSVKIIELLTSPNRWPELRSNARRFVETQRSWRISVAGYREIYARLTVGKLP